MSEDEKQQSGQPEAEKPNQAETTSAEKTAEKPAEKSTVKPAEKAETKQAAPVKESADAKPEPAKSETKAEDAKPAAKSTVEATDGEKPEPAAEKKQPTVPKKPAAPGKPAAAAKPAAKAKKEPPPPDPKEVAAKEKAEQVKQVLVEKFGDEVVEEVGAAHYTPMVRIEKSLWLKAVDYLRTHEDWQLNYVECMAGTDYADYIETVIFVQSTELGHFLCFKTRTDREKSEMPSLVPAYPGLNWEEREIYDLLGVQFVGHPDLRRIMMWEGFEGHPLRKDYNEWDSDNL